MALTIQAPAGAHFEFEEVKTKKGTESLGDVPILVWDDLDAAIAHYGNEGVLNILDGTSVRVSMQSIARRLKADPNSSDDMIAQRQIDFRPGKRVGGVSKPENRAAKSAKAASEKVDGNLLAKFLEKIAAGEISEADVAALAG